MTEIDKAEGAAHTPGPWCITGEDEYASGCPFVEISSGEDGTSLFHVTAWAVADVDRGITDEDRANARLIAAAPEMLAALELALEYWALEYWAHRQQRYKNRLPVWVQTARAAIAKAKGAQHD
ncbi:MAG: hypothetical protein F8N37_12215 [Telmatospirillum sp.]|nr:hypothetical protein [Telmatospirillum sp.]